MTEPYQLKKEWEHNLRKRLDHLQEEAEEFIRKIWPELLAYHLKLENTSIDHLCFRVASWDEYQFCKDYLSQQNQLLTEAQINGRPICTFRLATPLKVQGKSIPLLELPAPGLQQAYPTGFEHAEIVLPMPFEEFLKSNAHSPVFIEKARLSWRDYNPELTLHLPSGCIKFHYRSLDEVIELEERPLSQQRMVVFDLDGTLIDSTSLIKKINKEVLHSFGVPLETLEVIGDAWPSTFSEVLAKVGLEAIHLEKFIETWSQKFQKNSQSHGEELSLFPGIPELLAELHSLGWELALWTARDKKSALYLLERHQLLPFFKRIWTFHDSAPKPSASGLQYLCGARPSPLVWVVGDSFSDKNPADALNYEFFMAAWGEGSQALEKACVAENVLKDPRDLLKRVKL